MSNDKHRSLHRRVLLLHVISRSDAWGGMMLNHEGGMSSTNADLVKLREDGHIDMIKKSPPKRFEGAFLAAHRPSLCGHAPRLRAKITEAGKAFLERNIALGVHARALQIAKVQKRGKYEINNRRYRTHGDQRRRFSVDDWFNSYIWPESNKLLYKHI